MIIDDKMLNETYDVIVEEKKKKQNEYVNTVASINCLVSFCVKKGLIRVEAREKDLILIHNFNHCYIIRIKPPGENNSSFSHVISFQKFNYIRLKRALIDTKNQGEIFHVTLQDSETAVNFILGDLIEGGNKIKERSKPYSPIK